MTVGGAIEDLGGRGNRGSGKEGARVQRVGVASSCLPTTSVVQTADQNLRSTEIHTSQVLTIKIMRLENLLL